jgi:lysophospholipase L1-like esterase
MSSLSVCVLGDSIVENWGPGCPSLLAALRHQYSQVEFEVFNHGVALSRVGNALHRVSQEFRDAQGLQPSVASRDPLVVVVESMAYSHRSDGPEGMAEYRDLLRRIADEVRSTTGAHFLFCLAPPPHRERFLENDFLHRNTSKATRQRFADDVRLYLDEARRIAQDEMWPIADVPAEVEKVITAGQNPRRLTDQSDSFHPSLAGYELMASVITRAIDFHRMVDSH